MTDGVGGGRSRSPQPLEGPHGPNRKHLFVVGSPRSGTTWLQLLLAQHDAIATGKETQLFTQYVPRLLERWEEELREAEAATTNGLTRVLSETEFVEALRAFSDRVFQKLGEQNPGARYVLEKSPEHGLHARTILDLYPDARFLHIIRDPRSVSNSFRHAAGRWWSWAPSGPIATTRRWRSNVNAARKIPDLTDQYREVRYEDLLEKGEQSLEGILDWLDLRAEPGFCRTALEACEIENLKDGRHPGAQPWDVAQEPKGFFRSGRKDSWREELSRKDIRVIEHEAGGLLTDLGYTPETKGLEGRVLSARHLVYRTLDRLQRAGRDFGHRADWRLTRMLSRL